MGEQTESSAVARRGFAESGIGRAAGLLTARFGSDGAASFADRLVRGSRAEGEPREALHWNRLAWTIRQRQRGVA